MVVYEIVDYVHFDACEAVCKVNVLFIKKAFNIIKIVQFYTLIKLTGLESF